MHFINGKCKCITSQAASLHQNRYTNSRQPVQRAFGKVHLALSWLKLIGALLHFVNYKDRNITSTTSNLTKTCCRQIIPDDPNFVILCWRRINKIPNSQIKLCGRLKRQLQFTSIQFEMTIKWTTVHILHSWKLQNPYAIVKIDYKTTSKLTFGLHLYKVELLAPLKCQNYLIERFIWTFTKSTSRSFRGCSTLYLLRNVKSTRWLPCSLCSKSTEPPWWKVSRNLD